MRKVSRKAFRENANIFKRDAKRFELGMFDVKLTDSISKDVIINGGNYYYYTVSENLRNGLWFDFKAKSK